MKHIFKQVKSAAGTSAAAAKHPLLGDFTLSCDGDVPLLIATDVAARGLELA